MGVPVKARRCSLLICLTASRLRFACFHVLCLVENNIAERDLAERIIHVASQQCITRDKVDIELLGIVLTLPAVPFGTLRSGTCFFASCNQTSMTLVEPLQGWVWNLGFVWLRLNRKGHKRLPRPISSARTRPRLKWCKCPSTPCHLADRGANP